MLNWNNSEMQHSRDISRSYQSDRLRSRSIHQKRIRPLQAKPLNTNDNNKKISYTKVAENSKVVFHSDQITKTQKGDFKPPLQSNFTTPTQQNKITNNDKTLIYGCMEKLENMFQNIMEQITKLTNRVAVLKRNYGPE